MPWMDNEGWDRALEAGADATPAGGTGPDFLFRRGELIVPEPVWIATGGRLGEARAQIADFGAREINATDDGARQARKADEATRLGFRYVAVQGDVDELVVANRDVGVTYNHIVVANPQRHGGCAPPVAIRGTPGTAPSEAGAGIRIAVLDTGMPDPAPFDVEPFGEGDIEPPVEQSPPATDADPLAVGHGSMVAGVIRRHAPAAAIVVRRVLDTPLGVADELDVAAALREVRDVHIVNASFGGPAAAPDAMVVFRAAVEELPSETVLVASAGNEGETRPHYMAGFERVLSVASVQSVSGHWEVEAYSNRGDWIDVCAVGTDVESVNQRNRPVACSGTSFAAPFVSARIAALASGGIAVADARDAVANDPAQPLVPAAGRLVV
jgi:Subtilase family